MKTNQQGSRTDRVQQDVSVIPYPYTVNRFLEMIPSHLRAASAAPSLLMETPEAAPATKPLNQLVQETRRLNDQARENRPSLCTGRPAEPPPPRVLASYPDAELIAAGCRLTKGERRLWLAVHRLAVDTGRFRRYTTAPGQLVFHVPAVSLAGYLDYHPDHIARLGRGLERAGLLDCGGHAQQVGLRTMYDGCLWGVKMIPDAAPPRIRADEWRHNWRPGFEADVYGKTGAAAEMSGLRSKSANDEIKYQAVKARAAAPDVENDPLSSSPDNFGHAALRAVIDGLAGLWKLHRSKRPRAVGLLASQIAAALTEPERRRYWCRVIWQALTAQDEGRTGGLQPLAAQIDRLRADMLEGAPWRSPGAVLAARLICGSG